MNGEEAGRELDPLPFASVLLIHGTAAGTADDGSHNGGNPKVHLPRSSQRSLASARNSRSRSSGGREGLIPRWPGGPGARTSMRGCRRWSSPARPTMWSPTAMGARLCGMRWHTRRGWEGGSLIFAAGRRWERRFSPSSPIRWRCGRPRVLLRQVHRSCGYTHP